MGIEAARARKKPNNERAAPSELKHFLCYFCGDCFSALTEYQKHIVCYHQVLSIAYQMWNAKVKSHEKRRKSKGTDSRSSVEGHQSTSSEKELEPGKVSKTSSSDHSTSLKRALKNEVDHRAVKKRKTSAAEKSKTSSPNQNEGKESSAKVEKKTRNRQNDKEKKKNELKEKKEQNEFKEQKKAEIKWNSDSLASRTAPSEWKQNSFRNCEICSYTCSFFHHLIGHYTNEHGAKIGQVRMFLFTDQKPIARKICPPGDSCPKCEKEFFTQEEYFLHLLEIHVPDVIYQLREKIGNTNNADTEVVLKMPNKPDIVPCYNASIDCD